MLEEEHLLGINLIKLYHFVINFYNKNLKSIGITINQFYLLKAVSGSKKNIAGYAKELGIERSTASRSLLNLEKIGLVIRKEGHTLSESGIKTFNKCITIVNKSKDELDIILSSSNNLNLKRK